MTAKVITVIGMLAASALSAAGIDVAFIGGGEVAGWKVAGESVWKDEIAGRFKAVNLAKPGEFAADTLQRLADGMLDGLSPKAIVYMPGIRKNPENEGVLVDALEVRAVLRMLSRLCPDAVVIFNSSFPQGELVDSPERIHADQVNRTVGCYIYRMTQGVERPKILTCDFNALVVDRDGKLPGKMLDADGSPSKHVYKIWAGALKPYIEYAFDAKSSVPRPAAPMRAPVGFESKVTPRFAQVSKNWITGGYSAKAAKGGVFVPDERLADKWREFKRNTSRHYDLVMVGDSITHLFETGRGRDEWAKLTENRRVLNLGFGGNTVRNALWNLKYAGFLDSVKVDAITLMIGTNNRGESAEFIVEAIREIVSVIKSKQPEAKIILHPMLPRTKSEHAGLRAKNEVANAMIRKLADGANVVVEDLNALYDNASPEKLKSLLPDGTHPGAEGYKCWREAIEKHIGRGKSSTPALPSSSVRFDVSSRPGGESGVFCENELPFFTLNVRNASSSARVFEGGYVMEDYFGRTVAVEKVRMNVPPKGEAARKIECPEAKLPGFYCVTVTWAGSSGRASEECSFVKVAAMPEKPDRLFGISAFAKDEASLYAKMGVGTKAIYFDWRAHDDGKGNVKLDGTHEYVKKLRARGITVVGHFPAASESATPRRYLKPNRAGKADPIADPPKMYSDMQKFVETVVARFKDDIHEWSASAEINLLAGRAPYLWRRYVDVVRLISRGVKKADPEAELLALGCSGADGREKPRYQFLQKMLPEVVDYIDGFGIDQYTAGQQYGVGFKTLNTEESELRDIMLSALAIAKRSGGKIVAIDEKGPSIVRSTLLSSKEGRTMANMVARDFIILKTLPDVRHWLYFRPRNWNPRSVVDWGMWEGENPRQTVSAYASTARIMAHADFTGSVELHRNIVCWTFRNGQGDFAALWYNGAGELEFTLPPGGKVSVRDIHGNDVRAENRRIMLSDSPLYLHAGSTRELKHALESASYSAADLEGAVDILADGRLAVALRNVSNRAISARIAEATLPEGRSLPEEAMKSVDIGPGAMEVIRLGTAAESCRLKIESSNRQSIVLEGEFKPYRVRRITGFKDMSVCEEAVLENPALQVPSFGDLKSNGLYTGLDDLSVRGRFGYDEDNFYIELKVKDDIHFNNQTPARCFVGDSVQYAFDTLRDGRFSHLAGNSGWGDDDYRFTTALADGRAVSFCFGAASCNRSRMFRKEYLRPEVVRCEKTKTTVYRCSIPFSDLAPLKPESGRVFGFSFLAFDKDGERNGVYRIECTAGLAGSTATGEFTPFVFDDGCR